MIKGKVLKTKKSPLLAKIKFEPTFFQVLWRFAFPLPLLGEAGSAQIPSGLCGVNSRGLRGIFTPHFERSEIVAGPPAEPVNEIGSDIFKYIPPVGKSSCWLARYAGSPPDFERKIEFFVFVPQSGTPEAGFSKLKL